MIENTFYSGNFFTNSHFSLRQGWRQVPAELPFRQSGESGRTTSARRFVGCRESRLPALSGPSGKLSTKSVDKPVASL